MAFLALGERRRPAAVAPGNRGFGQMGPEEKGDVLAAAALMVPGQGGRHHSDGQRVVLGKVGEQQVAELGQGDAVLPAQPRVEPIGEALELGAGLPVPAVLAAAVVGGIYARDIVSRTISPLFAPTAPAAAPAKAAH